MIVIGIDTGATGAVAIGSRPGNLSIFDLIPESLTIGRQSRNVAAIGFFVEHVRRCLAPDARAVAFIEAPVLQPKNGTVNAAQAGAPLLYGFAVVSFWVAVVFEEGHTGRDVFTVRSITGVVIMQGAASLFALMRTPRAHVLGVSP